MNHRNILVGVSLSVIILSMYLLSQHSSKEMVDLSSNLILPANRPDLLDRLFTNTTFSTIVAAQQLSQVVSNTLESPDIKLLTGHWLITHRLGDNLFTDNLLIDQMPATLNGIWVATGQLYLNQGVRSIPVYCGYENARYQCLSTRNTVLIAYEFELSNDQIKNGHIGISQQLSKVKTYLHDETFPFTGSRRGTSPIAGYQSNYQLIQWIKRGLDNQYCLDILDDQGKPYGILNPVQCGIELMNFRPNEYITHSLHLQLPKGFAFRWRVASKTIDIQGRMIGQVHEGGEGYEGRVMVE